MLVIANTAKNNTPCDGLMPNIWMIEAKTVSGFNNASAEILSKLCWTSNTKKGEDSNKNNRAESTEKKNFKKCWEIDIF